MKFRIEKDSLGEVKVPQKALWGAQTQRALDNFTISGIKFAFPFGRSFIEALGIIKYSAAAANNKLKLLPANKSNAIKSASKDVLNGLHDDSFPLDVFQTGSGTSTNMNSNEVIANLASKKSKLKINANDDVNMSQSSNDVIPTAICVSALIDMNRLLLPNLDYLIKTIDLKMKQVKGHVKTGRTHLMDAMPIDFAQELSGWKAQLEANKKTIVLATNRMNELPQPESIGRPVGLFGLARYTTFTDSSTIASIASRSTCRSSRKGTRTTDTPRPSSYPRWAS